MIETSQALGAEDLVDCRYLGDDLYYQRFEAADGTQTNRRVFVERLGEIPRRPDPAEIAAADVHPWHEAKLEVLVRGDAHPEVALLHLSGFDDLDQIVRAQVAVDRVVAGMPSCMTR